MRLYHKKEKTTQVVKMLRHEAIVCGQYGANDWNAKEYKKSEAHYQEAADKIEKIVLKTKRDRDNLKFYKNEVLRCQAMGFYQLGKECFDAKDYEKAQAHYQQAICKTKEIVSKKKRDRENLAFYKNEILRCQEEDEPRLQAAACADYGNRCYTAKQYEDAKMHFQEAVEKLEKAAPTQRNEKTLKSYKNAVLECEMNSLHYKGNKLYKKGKYNEAKLYYQAAIDTMKKLTVKTVNDEKCSKICEDAIQDCHRGILAENLCQLACNEPIALFAIINKLQNNLAGSVDLIKALGRVNLEGNIVFRVITQRVPAVLPFIYECVGKVNNAAVLAYFMALAKKEKIATAQLVRVMDAFQNAVRYMDKDSAVRLQNSMNDALINNKSPYRALYMKKGLTSLFHEYGETKISIDMKNALKSRLNELAQPLMNSRPRVTH